MFRKRTVDAVGGYKHFPLLEDYYLWVRMLVRGYKLANLSFLAVEAQANTGYFERRGGLHYFRQEILLTGEFRKLGFHTWLNSLYFILVRVPFRLVSPKFRSFLYKLILRRR